MFLDATHTLKKNLYPLIQKFNYKTLASGVDINI